MSRGIKVSLLAVFIVFMLLPGMLHYIRNHEQMRISLAKDEKVIASLKSERDNYMNKFNSLASSNTHSVKSKIIEVQDFCLSADEKA